MTTLLLNYEHQLARHSIYVVTDIFILHCYLYFSSLKIFMLKDE